MTAPLNGSKKFVITFVLAFFCVIAVTSLIINSMSQLERGTMERIILGQSNKLSNVLFKLLYKAQALSALVVQYNGQVESFDKVAAILTDDPAIMNVILAPEGIVTSVYPLKGNEAVLGLNYFSEGAGNCEAIEARDKGIMVMGGPFDLVQGGQALVGRLPVYLESGEGESKFWGIVSVTLRFPQALDGAELNKLVDMGLAYELWRISPETGQPQRIASADYDYSKDAPYVEMPLRILNAEWFFRLSPILLWYQYPETWACVALGLLCSLLVAFLVQQNSDLHGIRQQLENLAVQDALTGILNRRGLLAALSDTMVNCQDFILYFIDLDGFKRINDEYGHDTGDTALRTFVQSVQMHIDVPHIFGRMGGDEFMLLVPDTRHRGHMERVLADLAEELQQNTLKGRVIPIVFSFGTVSCPDDGDTLDALLAQADERMYRNKRREM